MTWFQLIYLAFSVGVGLYAAMYSIGEKPNDSLITLRKFKELWNSRNIFGKAQVAVFAILFLPGILGGFVILLAVVAIMFVVMKFVDLGRKK